MKNLVKHVRIVFLIMLLGALDLSACTNAVNDTNFVASFAEKIRVLGNVKEAYIEEIWSIIVRKN